MELNAGTVYADLHTMQLQAQEMSELANTLVNERAVVQSA